MRHFARWIALSLFAMAPAACSTPSLHGVATPQTTLYSAEHLGAWQDDEGNRYKVRPGPRRSYAVTVLRSPSADGGPQEPVEILVWVTTIEDVRYIDVTPAESERKRVSERYGTMFVAAHNFARTGGVEGGKVAFEFVDPGWVNDHLEGGATTFEDVDDSVVLTADSTALRRWLASLQEHPKAFLDPVVLHRVDDQ